MSESFERICVGRANTVPLKTQLALVGKDTAVPGWNNDRLSRLMNTHGDSSYYGDIPNLKCSPSIVNECDEPIENCVGDSDRHDFDIQVLSTDIKPADYVQTSSSLLLRTPDLPKRCPDRIRVKVARKCSECCDCQQTGLVESTGISANISAQTEPWRVLSPECSQTGPSLTAVGAFCRFDYKLMKTRLDKSDAYLDCCWPHETKNIFCSRDRDGCFSFNQQVYPLDITVSETVQTEDGEEDIEKTCLKIMYGSMQPQILLTAKNRSHLECNCPLFKNGRSYEIGHCFLTQVNPSDICPTKITQTDLCLLLPQMCKKSKISQNNTWKNECGVQWSLFPQKSPSVSLNFSQQVTATDINDSNETQTCWYLSLKLPFRRNPAQCSPRKSFAHHVICGRTRVSELDWCYYTDLEQETGKSLHACTQVCHADINVSTGVQTVDAAPTLTKYYIRNQQWAWTV